MWNWTEMTYLYFGKGMTVTELATELAGFDLEEGFAGIHQVAGRGVDFFTVPAPAGRHSDPPQPTGHRFNKRQAAMSRPTFPDSALLLDRLSL